MLVGFRTNARVSAPWKQALAGGIVNRVLPAQLVEEHPNLEHHVRHSALPRPCGLMIDAFAVRARV